MRFTACYFVAIRLFRRFALRVDNQDDELNNSMRLNEFTKLDEIKKGARDSNGFSSCWTGYHAQGTKKGKNGGRVRNCVKNEDVNEGGGAQQAAIAIAKKKSGKYSKTTGKRLDEMPASLRNDPEGHTIIPHGGMGSGKEETWVHTSVRKLQECIDMIKSGNYTGAEHVLYKGGFLEGAVKALARYQEFKHKQGRRPLARGREVDLG